MDSLLAASSSSTFYSTRSIASSSPSAPLLFRSIFQGSKLTNASLTLRLRPPPRRSVLISACASWENPPWSEDDFVVIGLAHCFRQTPGQKQAEDIFVVEPLSAGTLESMENGAPTSYCFVAATTLGAALRQSLELLPPQFAAGESVATGKPVAAEFAQDFEFRTRCASRTWKRPHAVSNLRKFLPPPGSVRSDFNFSIQHKRILNARNVVTDKDNIKQDMSIDVYGRDKEETKPSDEDAQIESLYNL